MVLLQHLVIFHMQRDPYCMGAFYSLEMFAALEKEWGFDTGVTILGATEDPDDALSLLGQLTKFSDLAAPKLHELGEWTVGYETNALASTVTKMGQVWTQENESLDELHLVVEKHVKSYVLCFWLRKGCRSHEQHRRFNLMYTRASKVKKENSANTHHEVPLVDHSISIRGDLILRLGPVHYQITLGFESDNFEQLETSRCLLGRYVD